MTIIIIADFTKLGLSVDLEVDLDANPTIADVSENILFNWTIIGDFNSGWINFGDGNVTSLSFEDANSSISHKYLTEGKYNVTLYAKTSGSTENTDCLLVNIKNNAPQFNISLSNSAYEDQNVNISVIDLVESDHDKQAGVLTYLYNFADGEQITSNQSSCIHNWKNRGTYKVTITVIDDQGALDQKSRSITINNKPPEAEFTLEADVSQEQIITYYYGTFDFQKDSINEEPEGWNIYDLGNHEDKTSSYIYPNGDVFTYWDEPVPHWSRINEIDEITISSYDHYDEQDYTTFDLGNNIVTGLTIRALGYRPYYSLIGLKACYRIGTGSYSSIKQFGTFSYTGYQWRATTWSGLALHQNELNDLRIKIIAYEPCPGSEDALYVDTVCVQVHYEPSTQISVVDMGGDYKKVCRLYDYNSGEQAWMKDFFMNQDFGTIQFHVRSSDATSTTWALSLWDDSLMAFQIFMDDDAWKYTTSSTNTITECGTPLDNTWYWVSIDFCVSGTYRNLTAHQFRITVNDDQSNTYSFSGSINDINEIRIESSIQDEGVSYIDAIGYSFDLKYKINDNKYPSMSYPEKSNVRFSAALSNDTISDLSSLRFYWDFGDNSTSGFGKYVTHSYLESGVYIVYLYVKDDNGAIDSFSHYVLIHNTYPTVNFTGETENISVNEGETLILGVQSEDDMVDLSFLEYYWDFNASEFDPYNISGYESGGWFNSHIFTDDFNGQVGVMVIDPEGAHNSTVVDVTVSNVDPTMSITEAYIIANISFEVYRNSISSGNNCNFTFTLFANNDTFLTTCLNFSGSEENIVYSNKELVEMTLSKCWKVMVNSSASLPQGNWFRYYIKLQFLNGEQLIISSEKLYGGSYGSWEVILNSYWFDNDDFTFSYPLSFDTLIWDPSTDDITLELYYQAFVVLEINCTDTLPINDTFVVEHPLNNVSYTISIYEQNNTIYASIDAEQLIVSELYENNDFPVNLNSTFTIYPIIDLFELLNVHLNLTQLSIIKCNDSINFLEAEISDDDGGNSELTIVFSTQLGIDFQNILPMLELYQPSNASGFEEAIFYLSVIDFDLLSEQSGLNTSYYKSYDVPDLLDDFELINGTSEGSGDIAFQDGNYAIFNSVFIPNYLNVPSQPGNFSLSTGTSDWSGNLNSIDGNYTIFTSEEHISTTPEYIDSISYTKSVSGPGTIANTYIDDESYKQVNAKGTYYRDPFWDWSYTLKCSFNFNPVLAGRDFYLSIDLVSTKSGVLKVNGQTIRSGTTIDEDDIYIEDVTSISWDAGTRWSTSFYTRFYYFKLRPIGTAINFTSTLKVQLNDTSVLFYSHKTNISQSIDVEVWNNNLNQWDTIDTSSYCTFSEHCFTLNSDYYNENLEIFVNFYGFTSDGSFSLSLDMLKVGTGNFSLDFAANFVLEDITNEEELKFVKLYSAYKTNSPQHIEISLYNFHKDSWILIDTSSVTSTLFKKKFSIQNSEFYNSSYNLLIKVKAINSSKSIQLSMDQLKVKYYWANSSHQQEFNVSYFEGNVTCDFGHNSLTQNIGYNVNMSNYYQTVYNSSLLFDYAGEYLITWTVQDDDISSIRGQVVKVTPPTPSLKIGDFPNQTVENQNVKFSMDLDTFGSNATMNNYSYVWSFGDGYYEYIKEPFHAFSMAGVYNISLTVVDCYGNYFIDVRNITILERAPEIVGPYTFYGVEGQAIILNISIFDSFLDEIDLEYKWYNSTSLFSTDKKPSVILHDGIYDYILNVTDNMGQTATANISVIVEDAPPVVLISNYIYSGTNATGNEGFFTGAANGAGELEINAYGYDMYENSDFDYTWTIFKKDINYTTYDFNSGQCSTVKFRVTQTTQYRGQVKIGTANNSCIASFIINSFIDSNGNGISDETEEMILEFYENVTSYSDSDDDGLTDLYEINYNITDYLDPDSDDDGLWDGLHNETGIGEQTLWTDGNDADCDNDLLTDGIEVIGWNITTELYGKIVVSSNPWKSDTDGDGLSDYDEYYAGTDPRDADTDNDGFSDPLDPYPLKWDYDGDGLSDKKEYDIGTSLNNTDSDGDGLTDGEEVLGWGFKSNPLTADSDHDFAADNAEIKNHRSAIEDRYDLDEAVTILFGVNCEKAASAQIAFMITFGEAINEPENNKTYGIQDVPDINVSIYKTDDNLLLFNMTSAEFNQTGADNSTRYLSKVIDIRDVIESSHLDYRGQYSIMINDTDAGCMLEQFEIEVTGYLHPRDSDYDNDGIMDGVEMGLLVEGTDTIDISEIYGESPTIEFPREEIAWWTMDEGTGTIVNDSSYYDNNGTLNNMEAADWKLGKIGDYSLEFDGVDEYINCGDNLYLNFERNQSYTLSAWVKTSSANGSIMSKMNVSGNYQGYDMYCKSDGVIRAHLINALNSNEIIVDSSTQIDDGEWHFVVVTYNGSSSASGVEIYIDGSLDNLTTIKDTLNKTIQTDVDFTIGSRIGGNYFSGQIDDVRIYSKALNQNEINWLNNSGNGQSLKTLNITTSNFIETEYSIEIPHVGRVYDANLTLKVESVGIPIGSGNITIVLVKEEISCKIDDAVLIDHFSEFDNSSAFAYEKSLDLSDYLNNGSIYQYYGKFALTIKLYGTYLFDEFKVSDFYIETDTFVQAGTSDTEGWITNPAKKDSDDDGWDDYAEIFTYGTNPIHVDMDGDGVWDPLDRDPKRDVYLEISPLHGQSIVSSYKLQIVTMFTMADTQEQAYIPAVGKYPDTFEDPLWTAYFDGTHGSSLDLHYYVNINDNINLQSNSIQFHTEMWWIERYFLWFEIWDELLVSGDNYYNIGEVGHSSTLTVYKVVDSEIVYRARIKIKTIGVEKANTIAIYETNGTVFNGHYQEQERMNIIQLHVNDSGEGTPFEEGLNTIVIPTSLFTETLFNAHVQNETLNETPIYSSDEDKFKFISVGREGNTEQACGEIDFVIIRFDISSEDAMEVLDLLLTCLVNETTNETAVVYSYISTKLNGTSAVIMNLPISVLRYIPWFCNFSDSPKGSKPETFADWFWKSWNSLINLIIGIIITIIMAIVALVLLIIDFFVKLFMEILPILQYILWLIIRVLILIFIWIMFAFTLLFMIIILVSIIGLAFTLDVFMDLSIDSSINKVIVDGDINLSFNYNIDMEYNSFLDFYIPALHSYLNITDFSLGFSLSFFSIDLEFTKFSKDLITDLFDSGPEQSSELYLRSSSTSSYYDNFCDFITGIGFITSIIGTIVTIHTGFLAAIHESTWRQVIYALGIAAFIVSIIILVLTIFFKPEAFTAPYLWGMGIGSIGAGILYFALCHYIDDTFQYKAWFRKIVGDDALFTRLAIVDLIFSGVDIFLNFAEFFDVEPKSDNKFKLKTSIFSITTGLFAIFLSTQAIVMWDSKVRDDKSKLALIYGGISLIAGIIFIALAISKSD